MSRLERTPDGRLLPGRSGNPAGRPSGARNRSTLKVEAMLADRAEELTTWLINASKFGNAAAIRTCFDRLAPRRKGRPVRFELPRLADHTDAVNAASGIVAGVAAGEITPQEAEDLIRVIESFERLRVARLELGAAGTTRRVALKAPVDS